MIKNFFGNNNLVFLEPNLLYLLVPIAVLFLLWALFVILSLLNRPRSTFGSKYPLIGKLKIWFFVALAGGLMVLAMAKPTLSKGLIKPMRGDVEVIIVIDRSLSMRADDLKPTRLDIAIREAANIELLLKEEDKAALFVFGKEAHRKIYLSGKFANTFDRLAQITFPKSLRGDGVVFDSDFAALLESIYYSMDRQDAYFENYKGKKYVPQKRSNRVIIIFSDGEDQNKKSQPQNDEEAKDLADYNQRLNKALAEFRKRGLKIYPVGIGTELGVKSVTLLKYYQVGEDYPEPLLVSWKDDVTRINKNNLTFLARSTGVTVVELNSHVWKIEKSLTSVRDYLREIINSNRRPLPEFNQSADGQDLRQYLLVASVTILIFGIGVYPFSGYFRND